MHVVEMSSLSLSQYVLYPGQEMPMDDIQFAAATSNLKLPVNSVNLLVIQSDESL